MLKDFITFRIMITPWLIQIFFWLAVIACLIGGVANLWNHHWIYGLQILVLGPIAARISAEWFILFFRMNKTVQEIRDR